MEVTRQEAWSSDCLAHAWLLYLDLEPYAIKTMHCQSANQALNQYQRVHVLPPRPKSRDSLQIQNTQ
jgi:hypothetical protein